MTGLFCERSWNENGADGAFYGRPVQLWYQIAGILTAIGTDYSSIKVKKYFLLSFDKKVSLVVAQL